MDSCATCKFRGRERVRAHGKIWSSCRPDRPEIRPDSERLPGMEEPAHVGKWPWVASDEWCGRHGKKDSTADPQTNGVGDIRVEEE